MTAALRPEAVAQMVADMQAGTPGPWKADGPVWNQIVWTDGENRLCFMAHSNGLNDDRDIANARRIARVPAMEQTILALQAQLAAMTEARDTAAARVLDFETAMNNAIDAAKNAPKIKARPHEFAPYYNRRPRRRAEGKGTPT